ncbi:MAG: asparagine--tRNA ligase, partial [Clostridia bacterium]|nr:asparagine--tRNA ligase [Clostridia bacterium]
MKRIEIADIYKDAAAYTEAPVTVCGWIRTNRDSKNLGFMEVNDGSCFKGIQVVFEREKLDSFAET